MSQYLPKPLPETIFVDESGNSGLCSQAHNSRYPYFIFGFIYCKDPTNLKIELKRLLKKLHKTGKYAPKLKELKFHPHSSLEKLGYSKIEIEHNWKPYFNEVRTRACHIINEYSDGIFAGVLDKRTITRRTWKSETIGNFLFNKSLILNILYSIDFKNTEVLYDKGRLSESTAKFFNDYMTGSISYMQFLGHEKFIGKIISFKDIDSRDNSGIWASDFVAGSFRHKFQHGNGTFLAYLRPKFIGSGSLKLWF